MKRELAIEFSRVTEAAALAGYKWLGRGDKNTADGAAVNAMRIMLNLVNIDGTIVIGEGEIDEAPMLYIGEKVGTGKGDAVDIAVDPIEGTRMTAMGQANALAVMAVGDKGCFLNAPDMYMEKLIVGPGAKGAIDLNLPLEENLHNIARALNKPLGELTVTVLAKPRHDAVIAQLQQLGVRVFAIPDGDVAASILTCMPDSEVDVLYGIGGAPEGVVSAAVIRALDGDMQGRLLARHHVKGDNEEELKLALPELNIGLVHGRMKPAEKQAVMQAFKQGEMHLLVATTVIEVGVDVPNSSLMIIENPERLGLAQLHQLRGRVGRGAVASHCVLLYKSPLSKTAQKRLQVLRDSNDGFVIAQKDLEIRGPGELLGTRQTGNAEFKVADLLRDQAMIPDVQRIARHIHERYPLQAQALIERWMPETERYSNA